MMADDQAH